MRAVDALLPNRDRGALLERMMAISARSIVNVLREQRDSPLLALDPIGAEALARAGSALAEKTVRRRIAVVAEGSSRRPAGTQRGGHAEYSRSTRAGNISLLCTSDGMMPE